MLINAAEAINVLYMLVTGCGLACGYLLLRDVTHDLRLFRIHEMPDPMLRQLAENDRRREWWRMAKQSMCFVGIWAPVLVVRPVLRDNPDPYIYAFYRMVLVFISVGLLKNSYTDLSFRHAFRARYAGQAPATAPSTHPTP